MISGPGFLLHPEAARDIAEICDYIAQENPAAARRVREEVLETRPLRVRKLAAFPKIGHMRPDLTSRPLRFHNVRSYVIVYAPDETPLLVLAVMHGRRNPRVMAAILRARE
jgi:plasmid stabilization system protein ParE